MTRRPFFRPFAAAVALLGSMFGGATTAPTFGPTTTGAREAANAGPRRTDNQAPPTTAVTAANLSLGMIDAPDFSAFRRHVPIWVGRPRSRYGRQHSPRV